MPTPVTAARQCLTEEAAAALDAAAAVSRRRGHPQTTSLHMVASLLTLPSSSLREACTRAQNSAYPTRVQFKALELSLSVSLDRLPKAAKIDAPPPVSNSLMAAIKRSQANQRRQPEGFGFDQQQQQQSSSSSSSIPVVKVELQNLMLSILDDPLVSRVLGDAGFRSCDVKMAALSKKINNNSFHPHYLYGCYSSRFKNQNQNPPLFLCHLSNNDDKKIGFGSKSYSYSFPFMGCYENSRRIGEVMLRNKKRNPLLLGVSACDALKTFLKTLESKIEGVVSPVGLSVVCVEDEVSRFVNGDCDDGPLKLRFEEVEKLLGNVSGQGVVLNLGDFKAFSRDRVGFDRLRYLTGKLARLLEDHGGKVWLIGAADSYEVYFHILNKVPFVEEEWDLGILPITSLRFSMEASYPRSSLMESFVPLGGFFSMPSDTKSSLSSACQDVAQFHISNDKYNQEVTALSNYGLCSQVAEPYQPGLPSWPQSDKPSGFADVKAKDDSLLLNARIAGLQKKWDTICHHHHNHQLGDQSPIVLGFQVAEDKRGSKSGHSNTSSSAEIRNKNVVSSSSTHLQRSPSLQDLHSSDLILNNTNYPSILSRSDSDGHTSPNSVISVSTDLNLGRISSSSTCREPVEDLIQDLSGSLSTSDHAIKSSVPKCQYNLTHFNVKEPEKLYRALVERVGQQEEAISSIVEAITLCETRTSRFNGDHIWINLRGPDRLGKKKLGLALAEILYGNTESFVSVDLSFPDETNHADKVLNSLMMNKYELTMRGTVVDYLVEKLSVKPRIVFLENVDKSDTVVQNRLSRAVKMGRLMDLQGREVNVSNSMFLATTSHSSGKESGKFSEENVLKAKGCPIQISVGFDLNDDPRVENMCLMNKQKIIGSRRMNNQCRSSEVTKRAHKASNSYLDLNQLPAQTSEKTCFSDSDLDSSLENSRSWLEDFDRQIDWIVVFKRLDFDSLAEKLFEDMSDCLHESVGSKCTLEIEFRVMQQILAAAYLFGNKSVEDWILQVVRKGFLEAVEKKFGLNARSVVKLVSCESCLDDEHIEGHLLPGRIIMN